MEASKHIAMGQSVPIGDVAYQPPQIEVVVTADELEREAQYGGLAAYGPPP